MTSNPHFGRETTATEAAEALASSIKGKNVVVTGTTLRSIGAATALAIASQSPETIILASRTPSKLDATAKDLQDKYPSVTIHKVVLDLASLDSVKAAAAEIDSLVDHIDVLINNAGMGHVHRDAVTTPDGTNVDLVFFTNHLGPFLFTHLLLPKLHAAARANNSSKGATRIINVSSHGHMFSPVRFHDYQISHYVYDGVPDSEKPPQGLLETFLKVDDEGYPPFIGYAQSKTANVLYATELSRRFKQSGDNIVALSLHPGSIETNMTENFSKEDRDAIDNSDAVPFEPWKTLDQGAATTIVAAFDPKLSELDVGGDVVGYLTDCQLADHLVAEHAKDVYNAQTLFHESERMLVTKTGL